MKISEMTNRECVFTQLSSRVLAVLVRNPQSWALYVDAVPGMRHENEWREVRYYGTFQREPVARAIVENLFHPGFEIDLPYRSE